MTFDPAANATVTAFQQQGLPVRSILRDGIDSIVYWEREPTRHERQAIQDALGHLVQHEVAS